MSYEKYHQQMLNEPSHVDKHFIEAIEEVKLLEDQRNQISKKKSGFER